MTIFLHCRFISRNISLSVKCKTKRLIELTFLFNIASKTQKSPGTTSLSEKYVGVYDCTMLGTLEDALENVVAALQSVNADNPRPMKIVGDGGEVAGGC